MLFVGFAYLLLQTNRSFQLSEEVDFDVDDVVVVVGVVIVRFVVLILRVVDIFTVLLFVDLLVAGREVVVVVDESIRKADSVFMFVGFGRFAGFHQAAEVSVFNLESSF